MTGQLVTMIQPIREKHVQAFAAWLASMAENHPEGEPEYFFQLRSQTSLARKLYRVDYALSLGDQPEFREFRQEEMLGFTPVEGMVGGIHVALSPFRWDAVIIELEGSVWNDDAAIDWFNRWFGFDGEYPARSKGQGPAGWIHACAKVGEALHVDFGSAPAEAFGELIDIAGQTGASRVVIRDAAYVPPNTDAAG